MYLGRIVELAPADAVFSAPNHPYTQALLDEVPRLEAKKKKFSALKGEIPSPLAAAARLPFPPALPLRLRALPRRPAGAQGDRAGPLLRLPPERRAGAAAGEGLSDDR